jgi:hypothetical protein
MGSLRGAAGRYRDKWWSSAGIRPEVMFAGEQGRFKVKGYAASAARSLPTHG